jgi:hypothetical protein
MNVRKLWSHILITVGSIAMLVGALDPMEGSLVILPGSGLVTLGTFLNNTERGLLIHWLCIFGMIAFGVGAFWALGAWGFGGTNKHSMWWGVLVLPYPIGWVMGLVSLLFRLVRSVRHRHAATKQTAALPSQPNSRAFSPVVILSHVCAAFLGLGAVILPVWLLSLRPCPAPLFPLVRTGIERMSYLTFLFLFISGLLLGFKGKGHPALLGCATMGLFPLVAIAEIFSSPTSHNLWPFEFVMYGLVSLSAVLGAFIGRYVQKRVRKSDINAS